MSKEDREKRGEPAHREERDDESAAPACLILESEPSSEIQDPSRERAAGTSHSPGRGARRSPTWPAGGEGRTPPTPCVCRARHVTPRHEPTSQQHIHEVLRHRPVFRARSLPPGSKTPTIYVRYMLRCVLDPHAGSCVGDTSAAIIDPFDRRVFVGLIRQQIDEFGD